MEKQRNSSTEHSRSVPKLRFPEFKDEWEKKKLGEVADIIMGQSPDGDTYNTNGNGIPLINGPVEFTEKYPVKIKWTSKPTKYCQDKDVLFCVRGSTTGRMNIANDKYCIGRGVAAIRANNFSISSFIELILIKNLVEILSYTTGSTFQNIDSKSLKEFKSTIPSLPEQKRIASFFTILDKKIAELKQKKTLLEQYKKGIMQKLFSQELRFKDENGKEFPKWEKLKLVEISDVRDGTHDSPKYVDKGFPFITSKNLMKDGSIDFENVTFITEADYNKVNQRSKVNINDILFGMIGTIGNPVLVKSDGFAIKNVALIKEKKELLNLFLIHFLKGDAINKQFFEQNTGGTQKFLSLSIVRNLVIEIPSIQEQTKIANFLFAIDEKTNRTVNQIQQTQQYKKGLLQNMFV